MAIDKNADARYDYLRTLAQDAIGNHPSDYVFDPADTMNLIHELSVHHAELEIQNQELIEAQRIITALHLEYRRLYDTAPTGYLTLDHNGIITRANITAATIITTSEDKRLVGSLFTDYVSPAWAHYVRDSQRTAAQTGKTEIIEIPLSKSSSHRIWVRIDLCAEESPPTTDSFWRLGIVDISMQRIEEARQRYLATVLENISDAVISTNGEFLVESWNKAAEQLYGVSEAEALGLPITEIAYFQHLQVKAQGTNPKDASVDRWEGELTCQKKDGSRIFVESSISEIYDTSVGLARYVLVHRDITERRNMDAQLRNNAERTNDLARRVINVQELERKKLAMQLHDEYGLMLGTLKIDVDHMKNVIPKDMDDIHQRLDETGHLISHAVDSLRKIVHGLRPPGLDVVGLGNVLESLCTEFTRRSAVHIVFSSNELPRVPELVKTALYRVLEEALANATRYSHASDIQVDVNFSEPNLILSVADNGEDFYQDVHHVQGIGHIGMADRMNAVNGSVEIQSASGDGTNIKAVVEI